MDMYINDIDLVLRIMTKPRQLVKKIDIRLRKLLYYMWI